MAEAVELTYAGGSTVYMLTPMTDYTFVKDLAAADGFVLVEDELDPDLETHVIHAGEDPEEDEQPDEDDEEIAEDPEEEDETEDEPDENEDEPEPEPDPQPEKIPASGKPGTRRSSTGTCRADSLNGLLRSSASTKTP